MDASQDYSQFFSSFLKTMYSFSNSNQNGTKNIFLSPFSIFVVSAFLLGGFANISQFETLSVLSPSLGLNATTFNQTGTSNHTLEVQNFQKSVSNLMMNITNTNFDEQKLISISNGMFVDKYFKLYESFVQESELYFKSTSETLDFYYNPENSRQYINSWVEKKTDDMIKDLLGAGTIDTATKMVLVNTILFIGKWMNAFDKTRTLENQEFKTFDDVVASSNVSMMVKRNVRYLYFETEEFQSLSLFYSQNFTNPNLTQLEDNASNSSVNDLESDFEITFLKPKNNTKQALDQLESEFISKGIDLFAENETFTELELVKIPKFVMEEEIGNLKEILSVMGMKSVFDPETADFSRMSPDSEGLFVSNAIHKARIEVDEAGTKAAAATAILVGLTATSMQERFLPSFVLDSPFIFLISHVPSKSPLFYGKVITL